MNKSLVVILFLSLSTLTCTAQESVPPQEFTLVTYNIENLFDADGYAVFDDYKPVDGDGNDLYTNRDVLTKIQNAIQVLKEYNEGRGPDIIAMVELESDFTPSSTYADAGDFLGQFAHTTLEKMLTTEFDTKIADLPSEWLLLKGMLDAGMWNYQVEVGYPSLEDGRPSTVQKTAVFSRFPILREKTRIHPLERARPILESWIDVAGNELVVFTNHWKSGASSWEMEEIRLQNAQVLRDRLDELVAENPAVDVVLAGDFNSDYNQKSRYEFERTAVNDVLGSTGDEAGFTEQKVYNLWYDFPINKRGSDTYRGKWGTLMQIMISKGMYDGSGIDYIDNSIEVGDFGFNTFSTSGEPKRWSASFTGSGFSDHLPVSMRFRVAGGAQELVNPGQNDDDQWQPISVQYQIPAEFKTEEEFEAVDATQTPEFFNEYFYLTATVTNRYDFVVNGTIFDVYTPSFRLNEVLSDVAGTDTEIHFYGRFSQYRGTWQFVVESTDFIEILE
jgi:exonuclease III